MRMVEHIGKPTVIDGPGIYMTRCGEEVVIERVSGYMAYGYYESGKVYDSWDVSGRIFPTSTSRNDIVADKEL